MSYSNITQRASKIAHTHCGLLTVDCGLWTVDCGLKTLDDISNTIDFKNGTLYLCYYLSSLQLYNLFQNKLII